MTLIRTAGGLVNVALANCPRCHGQGWWMEEESKPGHGCMIVTTTYQPFCNCAEEIKKAEST
jgi:hypothetical protein